MKLPTLNSSPLGAWPGVSVLKYEVFIYFFVISIALLSSCTSEEDSVDELILQVEELTALVSEQSSECQAHRDSLQTQINILQEGQLTITEALEVFSNALDQVQLTLTYLDDDIEDMEDLLDDVQELIDSMRGALNNAENDNDDLEDSLEKVLDAIDELENGISDSDRLQEQINSLLEQIEILRGTPAGVAQIVNTIDYDKGYIEANFDIEILNTSNRSFFVSKDNSFVIDIINYDNGDTIQTSTIEVSGHHQVTIGGEVFYEVETNREEGFHIIVKTDLFILGQPYQVRISNIMVSRDDIIRSVTSQGRIVTDKITVMSRD